MSRVQTNVAVKRTATALVQLTAGRGGREEWVSWAVLRKSLGLGRGLRVRGTRSEMQ